MSFHVDQTKNRGLGLFTDEALEVGELLFVAHDTKYLGFLNHSCEPICSISTIIGFWVCAARNILPGEELTIDYAQIPFRCQPLEFDCLCGSTNCRGHIKL